MSVRRTIVFLLIYAVTFFALDRINGTAFDLTGLFFQALLIGAFALAAYRVRETPVRQGYIDEHGHYRERGPGEDPSDGA